MIIFEDVVRVFLMTWFFFFGPSLKAQHQWSLYLLLFIKLSFFQLNLKTKIFAAKQKKIMFFFQTAYAIKKNKSIFLHTQSFLLHINSHIISKVWVQTNEVFDRFCQLFLLIVVAVKKNILYVEYKMCGKRRVTWRAVYLECVRHSEIISYTTPIYSSSFCVFSNELRFFS